MKLYSTQSAAAHLGVYPATVISRVLSLRIEPVAEMVAGSGRTFPLYSADALEQIRPTLKPKDT